MEVLVLVLDDLAHAEVGGEVGDAEDQPAHAIGGGCDLEGLDQRLRGLDQRLDLDLVLPSAALLEVVEQACDLNDFFRAARLGEHDAVEAVGRAQHYSFHVALEKRRMDIVGTHRHHLAAEVERVERLDHNLVTFGALELVGASVLEIRHHVVDRRFDGVGGSLMELHIVAGIGHLRARDDEAGAVIEYVHR